MAPYACVIFGTFSVFALLASHATLLGTGIQDLLRHPPDLPCRAWLAGTCVSSVCFLVGWAWLGMRCLRCGNEFRDNHRFCHHLRLFLVVQGVSAAAAGAVVQLQLKEECDSSTWTLHFILHYSIAALASILVLSLCLIRGPNPV